MKKKIFSIVSQVLSFRFVKQTSKNVAAQPLRFTINNNLRKAILESPF